MLSLYPAIEPFKHYHLTVTNEELNDKEVEVEHHIYVEECGNPSGIPVLFLHGGPGSGCRPSHRCFFDPKLYHIILFDQRGCGRSRPCGSLTENTTTKILQDIEKIRHHIGISKWLIFGGSWGATLALEYAQQFSMQVSGLILRGIFLARKQDIDWVYSESGAAKLFPEAWHNLVKDLPLSQQAKPLAEIYKQLTSNNTAVSNNIFTKLQHWEESLIYWQQPLSFEESSKNGSEKSLIKPSDKTPSVIQLHYSMNQCFIEQKPLLENIETIRHIPTIIIHGRNDMVCPVEQAWQLKQHWPEAELSIIDMAGHVASEPKMIDALVKATNNFAKSD